MAVICNLSTLMGKKRFKIEDVHKLTGLSRSTVSNLYNDKATRTDPVLFSNGRYRRFTPREVARIQSFPENFALVSSEAAQYRALGNAIPPVMFWHIANKLSEQIRNKKK